MDKSKFRINARSESVFGILSIVLNVVALLFFLTGILLLVFYKSTSALMVGSLELLSIILTIIALIFSLVGESRKESFHVTSHIGFGCSLVLLIIHITVVVRSF